MQTTPQEFKAVRRADAFADLHSVPPELRDIDAQLVAWARWCEGRPPVQMSPMFRLFRASFARAQYGALTAPPPVDSEQALRIERNMRWLPERARELLRGWYVYQAHPMRLCRFLAIRPADLTGELNAARRMLVNILRRH